MKKIVSILLALILCVGLLVSCGNEENSSSQSESGEKTSSFSEELSGEETNLESEKQNIYYEELSKLRICEEKSEFTSENSLTAEEWMLLFEKEWNYLIFANYNEFSNVLYTNEQKNHIDKTIFEDNIVFVTIYNSKEWIFYDYLGYRDISIDGTTLSIECDRARIDETSGGLICINYYIIPKSEFGETSVESITEIKVNNNKISSNNENEENIYYEEIVDFRFKAILNVDEFTPLPKEGWEYAIFTNYGDFAKKLTANEKENFDATVFEDNVVLVATHHVEEAILFEYLGYRDLTIDGTTLTIERDRIPTEEERGLFECRNYYIIPRSEFGNISPESITEIKANTTTLPMD